MIGAIGKARQGDLFVGLGGYSGMDSLSQGIRAFHRHGTERVMTLRITINEMIVIKLKAIT
jgi:hypothetical protein